MFISTYIQSMVTKFNIHPYNDMFVFYGKLSRKFSISLPASNFTSIATAATAATIPTSSTTTTTTTTYYYTRTLGATRYFAQTNADMATTSI